MNKAGIPTKANGYQMRSRLEATWAHFFDCIGWQWEYEPFDANGYIPDFVILGPRPFLVEIKPATGLDQFGDASKKAQTALDGIWTDDILYLGLSPFIDTSDGKLCPGHGCDAFHIGRLDEYQSTEGHPADNPIDVVEPFSGWLEGGATFGICPECHLFGISHCLMNYRTRPCDHYDGNPVDLNPHWRGDRGDLDVIHSFWAEAKNKVQWNPPR